MYIYKTEILRASFKWFTDKANEEDIEQLDILKKAFKYVVTFKLQGELVRINFSLTAIGINVKYQLRNVQMLIEKLEEK